VVVSAALVVWLRWIRLAPRHEWNNDSRRGNAIFVFASDDPYDEKPRQRTIRFVPHGRTVQAFGGHGPLEVLRGEGNVCTIPIMSNAAALVIVED
jgi:hypothetical protein